MIQALGAAAGQVEEGTVAHRLLLARELLMFVREEFGTILERWEDRKRELGLD